MTEDRVDRVLAAWRQERPDLDMTAGGVLVRILLLGKYLESRIARDLAPLGLQPWEFDVLAALRRAGSPFELSAGELARQVVLTRSAMTHRITRLEARGLVRRHALPEDRRSVLVQLTRGGLRLAERAAEQRSAAASSLLSGLLPCDRMRLESLLRDLLIRLESEEA